MVRYITGVQLDSVCSISYKITHSSSSYFLLFFHFFWCRTFVGELALSNREDLKHANDMIQLQTHLLRMGYATVIRDDNRICAHCTELTLIRIKCPATVISVAV